MGLSQKESQLIKGVGILMMLFLHLFNKLPTEGGYVPMLHVAGLPLAHLLTRAANPVPFFLIVSGYGLSYNFHRRGLSARYLLVRTLRLYVYYWIAVALFACIVHLKDPAAVPLDASSLFLNISALNPTYNRTLWFLFPYILLSLSAAWLFRLSDRSGWVKVLLVAFALFILAAYLLSRIAEDYFEHHLLIYQAVLYLYLLFPFAVGMGMERFATAGSSFGARPSRLSSTALALLLVAVIAARCMLTTSLLNTVYAFCFIVLFLRIRRPDWLTQALVKAGEYSMMMWMVHKFLFEDLFPSLMYGPYPPAAIYCAGIVLAGGVAYLLQNGCDRIIARIPLLRK